ncbi:MAG: dihydroorotase [Rhodospirillaceae bacterium]|nr:dihydroorotase [Rhodospirillaceae bacterium]
MSESYDLVVEGGICLTPSGRVETDIGIRDGKFAAFGDLRTAKAEARFAARGLHVLPGVIDTQVHFREPGLEHKEDLESGTRAAVLGGVTGVFEMPNTSPATADAAALADKLARAEGRAWCDVAFYVGATGDNTASLARLETTAGCCGVKVFMGASTGSLLIADDDRLEMVLRAGRRRVAIHAEDEARMRERRALAEAGGPSQHPVWRDAESALRATRRALALARKTARPVHILHVTTADEMPLLAEHKDIASVETTPQHLTLAAPECYERLGTFAQMNPPIRDAGHREGLWRALAAGIVDVIGSDHAPHTRDEKGRAYPASPSGMPGVQTLVPIMLDHVAAGRLSLERFVDLTSAGPQRLFNLAAKGRVVLGYDADLTIVDLAAKRRIENAWIASKCGWTPFDGMTVTGWPMATVVRGNIVMREGELAPAARGRPIRFVDTLAPR